MPKDKKKRADSDDDTSDTSIEKDPPPKKQKKGASSSSKNEDEENSWTLDKNRIVKIKEFRGKVYVDIREYYEADGEMKPGKKGISLTAQQYQKLKGLIEEIDEGLKKF